MYDMPFLLSRVRNILLDMLHILIGLVIVDGCPQDMENKVPILKMAGALLPGIVRS